MFRKQGGEEGSSYNPQLTRKQRSQAPTVVLPWSNSTGTMVYRGRRCSRSRGGAQEVVKEWYKDESGDVDDGAPALAGM